MPAPAAPLPPGWIRAHPYQLLAPLVALVAVAVFEQTQLGQLLEDQTVNLRFQVRASFDPPADPRLVFVGIDEASLAHFGRWPWPRFVEADLIKAIVNAGVNPHTIAFDVLFTEDSHKLESLTNQAGTHPDDQDLGDAAAQLASVITGAQSLRVPDEAEARRDAESRTLAELADPGQTVPLPNIRGDVNRIIGSSVAVLPVKAIRSQSLFGFVNDDASPIDDIRHTIPLVVRVNETVYPSFSLQTLCQMLNIDPDKVEVDLPAREIRLKNSAGKTWTIPINDRGEYSVNYRREENFHTVPFFGLMQNLLDHVKSGEPIAKDCDLENKTIVIGEDAVGLVDLGPTPLASKSPLPLVHLNVINNVLKNDYLRFVPWPWVVIGWALITWTSLLRLKDAPLIEAVLMPIMAVILYAVFAFVIFWAWSLQIALTWPVLGYVGVNFGGVVLRWREEQRGREQVKQVFSRMLSPEVMNHLLEHPENLNMGGSERPVTILFSDIRDYTKFSEGLAPAEVVRQLNVYFEHMVDCIKECRGTLHKYIGDAIMAAWGDIDVASMGPEKDAQNAVRAALMMRRKLRELNAERQAAGLSPLRIGIGLNHGHDVLVGLIGASSRSEFTVMGDAVNVASRLEGLTKEFHTDLAISESVHQLIGGDFLVRRLGFIQLKGKTQATVVYEVLAEKTDAGQSRMTAEAVARYEAAFDHFLARRFAEAEAGFLAFQKLYPDDYCVQNYLQAISDFSALPPPPDWDGRIVMKTK